MSLLTKKRKEPEQTLEPDANPDKKQHIDDSSLSPQNKPLQTPVLSRSLSQIQRSQMTTALASVVKVFCQSTKPNCFMPWQMKVQRSGVI